MTLLNKQTKKEQVTVIQFLQVQNTESINIHRHTVAVYGVNKMPNQQMQKWYHNFANGQVNITDKEPSSHQSISNMFIKWTDMNR